MDSLDTDDLDPDQAADLQYYINNDNEVEFAVKLMDCLELVIYKIEPDAGKVIDPLFNM